MGIPVNDLWQVLTSYSANIHVASGCLRAPTGAVGGTADSARMSTGGILNMSIRAGTGNALCWSIARDVSCTFPGYRSNSGAHGEA